MGKGLTRKNKLDVTGFVRDQDELPDIGTGFLNLQKSLVAENPPIITPEKVGDYMNNTR